MKFQGFIISQHFLSLLQKLKMTYKRDTLILSFFIQ